LRLNSFFGGIVPKLYALRWIVAFVWIAGWVKSAPYAMTDDSLIHLRYAGYLHDLHRITYDGVHFSYGTSSVAYVSLLAFLRGFSLSPLLPKIVSTVSYLLVILVLFLVERRFERRTAPHAIWAGLLLASLTPMAIRWLTDGMETSLVVLGTIVLALATDKLAHCRSVGISAYMALILLGFLIVLLRIELLILVVLATCTVCFVRRAERGWSTRLLAESLPMLLGAMLGSACIRLVFGHLLPDTALAKEGVFSFGPILGFVHSAASAFGFGIGLVLLTIFSGVLLVRELTRGRAPAWELLAWASANACLPIELALTVMRGQSIQGIRYFVWPVYFATLLNALQWARLRGMITNPKEKRSLPRPFVYGYVVVMLCLILPECRYALKAMKGRSDSFDAMRSAGLNRYRNGELIAGDIGWIGYFTGAPICDLNGLVGGRELARLSHQERVRRCAERNPEYLFLNDSQLQEISPYLQTKDWTTVHEFSFPNVSRFDPHYFMVRRSDQVSSAAASPEK
jgi:hypothetical protein